VPKNQQKGGSQLTDIKSDLKAKSSSAAILVAAIAVG